MQIRKQGHIALNRAEPGPPNLFRQEADLVNQSREGEVSEKEDEDLGHDLENLFTPEEGEILRQEVELWNGVKMRQSLARSEFEILCELYEEKPEQFRALVILVKQEPGEIAPETLAALRKRHFIRKDGTVSAPLAAVLDASYRPETLDNTPLRYPIRHATAEEAERITRIYDQIPETNIPRRFLRYLRGPNDSPNDDDRSR